MKSNRMGLLMIAATLAVIGLIVAAVFQYQGHQHTKQIRLQGVSLSRSLASLPLEQLAPGDGRRSVLQTAVGAQRAEGFAYALLVSPTGKTMVEVTAPGTTVPTARPPADAASWFGDRALRLPDTGQRVLEFHGPVMDQGNLVGFVRLGYLSDPPKPGLEQLSFAALLALPIFLLAPLFYGLMRRELRPLLQLSDKLQRHELAAAQALPATAHGSAVASSPAKNLSALQISELVQRLGRFLHASEKHMRDLETQPRL